MMNIGDRIKKLRKQKNINQSILATVMRNSYGLGTDRVAVSKWETGFCIPATDALRCLADYFDVSTDYLISGISSDMKLRTVPMYDINGQSMKHLSNVVPPYDSDADFCVVAYNNVMKSCGIMEGARVFVKKAHTAENNDIVVAVADDRIFICRYYNNHGDVLLINDDFCNEPIVYYQNDKIRIDGKVVSVQYSFV